MHLLPRFLPDQSHPDVASAGQAVLAMTYLPSRAIPARKKACGTAHHGKAIAHHGFD
jgi:hypothetical protein